ncbi:ABC transporter ATP-binding protein [Saccharibacillus sp. CPCC 101409]|uniref:ATP-binding cassette domain-containing protein n=1 Tax=Saccharibacillus sp. CPCC 101409 TaxID=3058041 RepID=UPI00267290FB|nr:ABC transporter ATP-binding protein [Saccharibacillus sp. CPCC 101409]MDO3409132.1 ABC transporter ATP-binding protein [Saccharibacillus sp. CPCC 101409]
MRNGKKRRAPVSAAGAAKPVITLDGVGRSYGARMILSEVSLSVDRGESVILRGSNGSGKSTLLKLAAGIIAPSSGTVVKASPGLTFGFAPDRLPRLRMTSEEYLTHMGRIAGLPRTSLRRRIEELHSLLDLPSGSLSMLIHYSKGMLQKVNLMQACLGQPELLLLDEPFSGLDPDSSDKLLTLLHGMRAQGAAVIAALHDPLPSWEAVSATYRLREGRLVREDSDDRRQERHVPVFYELDGLLPEASRGALARDFPQAEWSAAGNVLRVHLPAEACEAFMGGFWSAGGTLLSLKRKEEMP